MAAARIRSLHWCGYTIFTYRVLIATHLTFEFCDPIVSGFLGTESNVASRGVGL